LLTIYIISERRGPTAGNEDFHPAFG